LTASGWQDICVKFHRANTESCKRCQQSDAYIVNHLTEGEKYVSYECANGLVDVANPIIVQGNHIGTVFTGQFLFDEPDIERFRMQAQEFGFDESAYLEALQRVPVFSRESIEPILTYLSSFAEMLADVGKERIEQKQTQQALEEAQEELLQAQQRTIQELSTPLMPLSENVVAMPLVGTIDSTRAMQVLETLLEGVAEHQAERVIIDITGVKVVDTQVANVLLQAAQAVKLLGAEVILTGISPTLAMTLVHLGSDMSGIVTCSTLQAGIAYAADLHHGKAMVINGK
jgi:anti-anti-sigma factor